MRIESINNGDELANASPDTLKFHSTFKAMARMLIKYLPLGNVNEEEYSKQLTGNAKIIYEIIKEWEELDPREHRRDILKKPLLWGTFTYFFDSDFREVLNFMFWRGFQRQNEFFFPPQHLDPACWNSDESGERSFSGTKVPQENIVRIDDVKVVLNAILIPRLYWLKIGETYYAANTSRPVFIGDGWAYQLIAKWGSEDEFKQNACLGDHYNDK